MILKLVMAGCAERIPATHQPKRSNFRTSCKFGGDGLHEGFSIAEMGTPASIACDGLVLTTVAIWRAAGVAV